MRGWVEGGKSRWIDRGRGVDKQIGEWIGGWEGRLKDEWLDI